MTFLLCVLLIYFVKKERKKHIYCELQESYNFFLLFHATWCDKWLYCVQLHCRIPPLAKHVALYTQWERNM